MAILETKYSVGDVVYFATTISTKKRHSCPDCLGTGKWSAKSPAGGDFEFRCPRCSRSYMQNAELSLDYTSFEPMVEVRTIGSVRVDTAHGEHDSRASYMCLETGVGSGTVYNEDRLIETEDDAFIKAKTLAQSQNEKITWVAERYNQTLDISDYQLESATLKLSGEMVSRARSRLWNLNYLFENIREADSKEAILEYVEWYSEHDWEQDKAKFLEEFPESAIARAEGKAYD